MLLFARVAPQRVPKTRSKAGCVPCKEKKKKCDELRPACRRCEETRQACGYEAVKPRKRQKRSNLETEDATATASKHIQAQNSKEIPKTRWDSSLPHPPVTPYGQVVLPNHSSITTDTAKRHLFHHFHSVICHLIVIQESETGNAFQRLVAPLCLSSPAVAGAIYALASAHLECKGVALREETSIIYHNEAISQLSRVIDQGQMANQNELLAAVMLLVYYEVLVQKGRSSVVQDHLKGAVAIMQIKGGVSSPTGVFLERAFQFYDAITALSIGTVPLSEACYDKWRAYNTVDVPMGPEPVVNISGTKLIPINTDGVYQNADSADVLLGFATSLWPTIYKLCRVHQMSIAVQSVVVDDTSDEELHTLQADLLHAGFELEMELEAWKPPMAQDNGAGEAKQTNYTSSAVHTAMAYRHSALVYLYRNIYNENSTHEMVQEHVRASLRHCTATTIGHGSMGALLWPLFVASLEAQQGHPERIEAAAAFESLGRRQGMANIGRAWAVVQEVWRRADLADMGTRSEDDQQPPGGFREMPSWQRISEEMGFMLILG